jgi:hypothetical protein
MTNSASIFTVFRVPAAPGGGVVRGMSAPVEQGDP